MGGGERGRASDGEGQHRRKKGEMRERECQVADR